MNLVYDEENNAWKSKKVCDNICRCLDLQRELRELGAYNFQGDARDPVVWMKAVNRLIEQYASIGESEDENN